MTTITFAGNLADDPELKYTKSGKAVVRMTVIENRRTRADNGEWEDGVPNSYRVQCWEAMAENIAESLEKGARVLVTGTMVTDRWHDRETGEARLSSYIRATDIGVSLRFHTAQPVRANRTNGASAEDDAQDDE